MEIILIILTGTILGAFFIGFFFLGYYLGSKNTKENQDGLVVTDNNKEYVIDMALWRQFNGFNG